MMQQSTAFGSSVSKSSYSDNCEYLMNLNTGTQDVSQIVCRSGGGVSVSARSYTLGREESTPSAAQAWPCTCAARACYHCSRIVISCRRSVYAPLDHGTLALLLQHACQLIGCELRNHVGVIPVCPACRCRPRAQWKPHHTIYYYF
jgi:hypothetical protein